jgi:hypothetical protein
MAMNETPFEDDSIDLIALLKSLWTSRMLIIRSSALAAVAGVFVALFSPEEFTASTVFVPLSSAPKTSSSLSGLASLAGISIPSGASGGEISPMLYPEIMTSIPIKRKILSVEIPSENGPVSYGEFLQAKGGFSIIAAIKKYTIGLPGLILSLFEGEDPELAEDPYVELRVTEEEEELFELIDNQAILTINEKEGFISLSFTTEDPTISAVLTRHTQLLLQAQVIEFKVKNAKEYLDYTQKQFDAKQVEYFTLLDVVAKARDENKNINSQSYLSQFAKKEQELVIVQNVYNELAIQLEQAKLQVAKDTPIFSTIKPVTIPTERSAPKRSLVVVIWTFLGVVLSSGYVLVKEPAKEIIRAIKGQEK